MISSQTKHAAPEEQMSKVYCLRVVFVVSLAVAAIVCGATAYVVVRNLEIELAEQTYESIASSALKGAQAIARRKFQSCAILALRHEFAFPNASQWPNVALPGFVETGTQLSQLSNSFTFVMNVIVQPEEVPAFEAFARKAYQDEGYPSTAGYSDFGFGIWVVDEKTSPFPDKRVHDTSGNTTRDDAKHKILAPVLQISSAASFLALLYNPYPDPPRGTAIDSMLDCAAAAARTQPDVKPHCAVITDFLELINIPGPAAVLYQPIFPQNDATTVVGMTSASIHWSDVLTEIVPDYVDGLYCVVSTIEKEYTYVIRNGVPGLIGEVCTPDGCHFSPSLHAHTRRSINSLCYRVISMIPLMTSMLEM
jgi:hypothetical protein